MLYFSLRLATLEQCPSQKCQNTSATANTLTSFVPQPLSRNLRQRQNQHNPHPCYQLAETLKRHHLRFFLPDAISLGFLRQEVPLVIGNGHARAI